MDDMKANEFVKKYGLELSREIVSKKPKWASNVRVSEITGTWEYTEKVLPSFSIDDLKRLVEAHELVEKQGGLERVKKAIDGKHIGYTHFYLHSNGRYVFLDHYVDFIPDHAQHIGMFNKVIEDVESCMGEGDEF